RNAILSTTIEERENNLNDIKIALALVDEHFDLAKPLFSSDEGRRLIASVESQWQIYVDGVNEAIEIIRNEAIGDIKGSTELVIKKLAVTSRPIDNGLTELSELKERDAQKAAEYTTELY